MLKTKRNNILKISFVLIMSFIILYAGHFLLISKKPYQLSKKTEEAPLPVKEQLSTSIGNPIEYRHMSIKVNGNPQEVFLLEVEPGGTGVEIRPVLSFDSVFGFEYLSDMAKRAGAHAAVNAGFFHEFGQPAGMVAADGQWITLSSGRFPVLLLQEGKAALKQLDTPITAEYQGKTLRIDKMNALGNSGDAVLYTSWFGSTNRLKTSHLTLVLENGNISRIVKGDVPVEIAPGNLLISFVGQAVSGEEASGFKEGEGLEIKHSPSLLPGTQAYECGSWLVQAGRNVAAEKDEWVGVLTNHDPRTAVGVKKDGKVIFLVADGRQPGYSVGLTAQELAELLISLGAEDAAMLDGGASSEMLLEGKIVNRPSFKGQERPVGGGIVIKLRVDN